MQRVVRADLMVKPTKYKTIFIACDHAALDLKLHLIGKFPFLPWKDLGTYTQESVDYPDYAQQVCMSMKEQLPDALGVLICGSGQGMNIKANRYPFIRAALCWNEEIAKLSREHNDANVLCLGARFIAPELAERILKTFIETEFEGGRHARRVDKLSK